jgi:hypothetical protein
MTRIDEIRALARVMHEEGLAQIQVDGLHLVLGVKPPPAMKQADEKPRDLDKEIEESPAFADWLEGRIPTGAYG